MHFTPMIFLCLLIQILLLFVCINGQCSSSEGLPSVPNSYRSNVDNLRRYSNGTAFGYYDIKCNPGYALDPTIGGRITCLPSGRWSSPLPICKSLGACPISDLFDFIRTAEGIKVNRSTNFIYTSTVDDSRALGGSNITIECSNGYINVGGPALVVCTEANIWTPFPKCIPVSTSTSVTTSTRSMHCPITENTWKLSNGYVSNASSILVYDDNTATGSVVFSCASGYVMDTISQGILSCNAGTWSSRPYCTKTARCSLLTLRDFVNNPSQSMGVRIVTQKIYANPDEGDVALVGSSMLVTCAPGYNLASGNLNISCNTDGAWSTFPKCVLDGYPENTVPCSWKDGLPTVPNSHLSNTSNLKAFTNGLAYGFFDIACDAGYALDSTIGSRITCLPSGVWSQPLPICKSMGTCPISDLFNFIGKTEGILVNRSLSFVYTNGIDVDRALGGSNVTVSCIEGYKNIGGPLVIICTQANSWTPFPKCTPISTSSPSLSTVPSGSGMTQIPTTASRPTRCPTTDDTWKINNGFLSNTSNILVYDDNTASGSVVFSCSPGYVIDSFSQGILRCNAGTWSPRPYCTKTARCSLPEIKSFLNDPSKVAGLQILSQGVSANPDENEMALVGSYVLFVCRNGYTNLDGRLNVTCTTAGQWTPFPACILQSTRIPGGSN